MKWKADNPKHGEQRIYKRFAVFPVEIDNDIWIWLETYYVVREYNAKHWHWEWWSRHKWQGNADNYLNKDVTIHP